MRYGMIVALLALAQPALAGPYFRFEPFNQIRSGGFFEPTAAANQVNVGAVTSVIAHHAEDGHLLIDGVDWNLLDVGWQMGTTTKRGTLVLGPSLHLEEPIKAILLKGVGLLPGGKTGGSYGALRAVLAPDKDNRVYVALGPSFGLETASTFKEFKGHFLLSATLNVEFGR